MEYKVFLLNKLPLSYLLRKIYRHLDFLKAVFFYSLTAFGGPQGHYAVMLRLFVHKKRCITEEELLQYNGFCQLLPGASSTQMITLIGYKLGGVILAILTFLVWISPAVVLMSVAAFILPNIANSALNKIFTFIQAMTIGYIVYAITKIYPVAVKNRATFFITFGTAIITYLLFKTPWIFPIMIIVGGLITNISKKRIPLVHCIKHQSVRWHHLALFILIFLAAGILSETARKQKWESRVQISLFENFYRFGSTVFGGGDVLLPMLLDQYVERPNNPKIASKNPDAIKLSQEQVINGYGIVKGLPGPVFSVSAYIGGLAAEKQTPAAKLGASLTAAAGIFLPSLLLVLFLFPVWNNLQQNVYIYRSLEGINAVVLGFIIATAVYLLFRLIPSASKIDIKNLVAQLFVIVGTYLVLRKTSTKGPVLVLTILLLGYLFAYL